MERLRTEHLARPARIPTHAPSAEEPERQPVQPWLRPLVAGLAAVLGVAVFVADPVGDAWRVRLLCLALVGLSVLHAMSLEWTVRTLRARLHEERALSAALADRVDEWTVLLAASRAMSASLELHAVLQRILDAASTVTGAAGGSVQLVPDDDHGALEVAAVHGASPAPLGHRQRIGEGLAGAVAASREGRLLSGPQPGSYHHVDSSVVVPLLHGEQLVGVLNLAIGDDGEPFGLSELHVVGVLVEAAAAAIINARAHAAVRALEHEPAPVTPIFA